MKIVKNNESYYRILAENGEKVFVIDCLKGFMPEWVDYPKECEVVSEEELMKVLPPKHLSLDELKADHKSIAIKRYTMISAILTVLDDYRQRQFMIERMSNKYSVSKQTIRSYLKTYLIYQSIAALAPSCSDTGSKKELTTDQKNMRWALNKFFYTRNMNTLRISYTRMLKEKYTSSDGKLVESYPSFMQFRYFYRKTKKMETYYISRDGLSNYQRNNRPLLGDGVQEFAPTVGTAMLDSTVCDIYLVDETGQLVGRPILVAAVDTNTSLCLGYTLEWEGGKYSLNKLMLNILEDKVSLCASMGIKIDEKDWNVKGMLPGVMVTDQGSEYKSATFSQISELGVTLINLPPYRPELKGPVEKCFDVVQSSFKHVLKGKGVILSDFQERGSHDYRKDACLTLDDFERIVVRCIVHYNRDRILEKYPYTEQMLSEQIKPHASDIFNYMLDKEGANFIKTTQKEVISTLLPRTNGTFTRYGLKVNKLRYYADGYKEKYLSGGKCIVSYNPDDCSKVWVKDDFGRYIEHRLIESRFLNKTLEQVDEIKRAENCIIKSAIDENVRARVDLLTFIENVSAEKVACGSIKDVRSSRRRAINRKHVDIAGSVSGVSNE